MIQAKNVRRAAERAGVPVPEYLAESGCCGSALVRRASFTTLDADFVDCAKCGQSNRVERPA